MHAGPWIQGTELVSSIDWLHLVGYCMFIAIIYFIQLLYKGTVYIATVRGKINRIF